MSHLLEALSEARRELGLTQRDVAGALGTTQSAIARLEGGHVDPRLGTVGRYAARLGLDLQLQEPDLLASAADTLRDCLDDDDPDGALRAVIQLVDDLRTARDLEATLRREPASTGSPRWDSALAGACERAARLGGVPVPGWTAGPSRFLDCFWFPVEDVLGRRMPGLASLALATSPPEFAIRGVFIDADTLASR